MRCERLVNNDLINWLLEKNNPAARYATLTSLLGRSSDGLEVRHTQQALMKTDPVRTILQCQEPDGYWGPAGRFYGGPRDGGKYQGTVWQVIFLAQLGADAQDERIQRACEFVFRWSQNRETGGFSTTGSAESGGSARSLPCLTGNMVWALNVLGCAEDPRWRLALEWLLRHQQFDGGWVHCNLRRQLHSCFQGSIKPLMALVSIPPACRTQAVSQSIDHAIEFFLQHRLFRRDHHGFDIAKRQFLRFGFPLGWQTDVLDMLDVLTAAGVTDDEQLADAVAIVLSKRDNTGRWKLENTYNKPSRGAMWCEIEEKGKPSKWVTLKALRTLNRIGESKARELARIGKTT